MYLHYYILKVFLYLRVPKLTFVRYVNFTYIFTIQDVRIDSSVHISFVICFFIVCNNFLYDFFKERLVNSYRCQKVLRVKLYWYVLNM